LRISLGYGALRPKPAVRVRLHGRNRMPELALTMSLATTIVLLGASWFAPAGAGQAIGRAESSDTGIVEMRSAATSGTLIPMRKDIRIISLGQDAPGRR
jgi:hypothetical protein